MSNVESITAAISQLPPEQVAQVRAWLDERLELAQEDGETAIEYPVWSPYDAHDAAATLLQLLEREKASTT